MSALILPSDVSLPGRTAQLKHHKCHINPRPAGTTDSNLNNSNRIGTRRDCESLTRSGVEGLCDSGDIEDGPEMRSKRDVVD